MTANDNRPGRDRRPGQSGHRGNVAALVAVLAIAAALFWVISAIKQHNAVQDCLDSGRRDCVGVDSR